MASALSFVVNDNIREDLRMVDSFIDCHPFDHPLFLNLEKLIENSNEIEIDMKYDFRPDKLSYQYYGTNFWYPAILTVNRVGSIFQFTADYLNRKCLIPKQDYLNNLLTQ
jgi:hypothetical protein